MTQGLMPRACTSCGCGNLLWIQTEERTVAVVGVSADQTTLITRDDDDFIADAEFIVSNDCFTEDFVTFNEAISSLEYRTR